MRHQVDAARSAQALAHKSYFPEFGLSTSYGFRQGHNPDGSGRADFASAVLSVSVPLFAGSKQDRLLDQRNAELAASEQALSDARNRVQSDIAATLADYRRARDEVALLDTGILPQTEQAVASMQAGYQVNKVDFLSLIRTQVTLYNYELQRWRALSQAHQALATLAAAVGKESIDE
jgi:outer membrane protein TolC